MNKRRYPLGLFIFGFFLTVIVRHYWLFLPALAALILGIFVRPCLYIGLGILAVDVVLALIGQFRLRHAFLTEDDPSAEEFRDALSRDGNWRKNVMDFVEQQMNDPANAYDGEDEDGEGKDGDTDGDEGGKSADGKNTPNDPQ